MCLLFFCFVSFYYGFVVYYIYLNYIWKVDVVLYFGIYGFLEFMFGKQMGMFGECYFDNLIGIIFNLYYYVVNNFFEVIIVKWWGYVFIIFYLIFFVENVGLYKGLQELNELIGFY